MIKIKDSHLAPSRDVANDSLHRKIEASGLADARSNDRGRSLAGGPPSCSGAKVLFFSGKHKSWIGRPRLKARIGTPWFVRRR